MKISVIIPSFNQGDYLEDAIKSALDQNTDDIEVIVMDGGSNDKSIEILKQYDGKIKWVSEKDEGQADALNKGLKLATGEIIGWINSDDFYENNIFSSVLNAFKDPNVNWVVGNLTYYQEITNVKCSLRSPEITYDNLLNNPDSVRQQGTFFRKSFLEKIGAWNKQFYMIMDFDLWIRAAKQSAPKMCDEYWAGFRLHEEQKTSLKNVVRQTNEILSIMKKENIALSKRISYKIVKYFRLIKSLVKVFLIKIKVINPDYENVSLSHRKWEKYEGSSYIKHAE